MDKLARRLEVLPPPPKELGRDPMAMILRIQKDARLLQDENDFRRYLAMIDAAKEYIDRFGPAKEPWVREWMVARLEVERRLGWWLDLTVNHKGGGDRKSDDYEITPTSGRGDLPDWINSKMSSITQTLAKAPQRWFDNLVAAIKRGERRPNLSEIYLEAQRIVAYHKTRCPAEEAEETEPPEESEGIILGDFREVGSHIADESVALVFTDPPYDRDNLYLYAEVARFAARVPLPGGSLVVYAPNYAFPSVLELCGAHLRYWWTLALALPGHHALMREYGVRVAWKPLVWFTKSGRLNKQQTFDDVIQGRAKEKDAHEWQQQVMTAEQVVENLTAENDLVVDPMSGSATTGTAAKRTRRPLAGDRSQAADRARPPAAPRAVPDVARGSETMKTVIKVKANRLEAGMSRWSVRS